MDQARAGCPGPVVKRLSQTIHQDPAWRKEGVAHRTRKHADYVGVEQLMSVGARKKKVSFMLREGWVSLGEVGTCAGQLAETPGLSCLEV